MAKAKTASLLPSNPGVTNDLKTPFFSLPRPFPGPRGSKPIQRDPFESSASAFTPSVAVRFQRFDRVSLGNARMPMHNGSLPPKPETAFPIGQQGFAARGERYPIGFPETLHLMVGNVAKGRLQVEACLQRPQRAVRVYADVPSPVLSFQPEMRSDHPTFQVKDFMLPHCPESIGSIAMNAHDVIDRPALDPERPRNKANPVEPVQALGNGCKPKEAIRGLCN